MNVGVVIPFYQREPGILPRALTSIRSQRLPPDIQVEVIVVDDHSPVPAAEEMSAFADSDLIRWHVISQPNAGPGAARNTGIDWLESKDIRYLAFLDSDDEWRPDHLINALTALEGGGDFYFSDHSRTGDCDSYFNDDKDVRPTMHGIKAAHVMLDGGGARIFAPNAINDAMLENYLSQTSTVVLRRAALGNLRFDPELRHAGEDYMLWIQLALNGVRICISDEIEVVCGTGINMCHGSYDWDSKDALTRLSGEIVFHQKLNRLSLGTARSKVRKKLQECRRIYAYLLLRQMAKRNLPARTGLSQVMRHDPLLAVQAPLLIARFLLQDRRRLALSDSR
ncbi:glycosyltransferase family 2 protein [Paracoccus sp. MC1862]|uniref:glycosyltransferase family 2 protein n=1 Tax=Paracoccus sp. MC1862 TaxID=2760307 RepID=UPI0015FF2A51|nr:glycosyltransferase family 2 protein [Paracoccus sp. MC1862]MBB1499145.1 glycosyltransferase family 2 protein [Paracoccus sp. MC1862]QQO46797.1 glycosyltransferase family 2 protein [Paracoccus sp. MC1862]